MSITRDLERYELGVDELISSHQRAKNVTDFKRYWDDPFGFFGDVLNFTPYAKQREVVECFMAGKRTAVRGFHAAGKDATLAALMMFAAYVRGMLVLALSATEKQLLSQLWREVGNRFTPKLPGALYTSDLRINGNKRIIAMTAGAGSVSHLTGWHDPNGVFIAISESQAESVGESAFDAAEANAVDDLSKIVVVGNPVEAGTRFHAIHSRASWQCVRISAFDHPNISGIGAQVPGGPSKSWPDQMADEYGKDSAFYVSRVLSEFPREGAIDALLRPQWIQNAFDLHTSGKFADPFAPMLMSVDVAREGPDRTVVAFKRGKVIEKFTAWRGLELYQSADRVQALHREALWHIKGQFHEPQIVVDDNGIGGGLVSHLKERGQGVMQYKGSHKAMDYHRFLNQRAESAWALREHLAKGRLALPPLDTLREELLALRYENTPKGLIQLGAKEDIKKMIGRSCDYADAVMMAAMPGPPPAQWGRIGMNGVVEWLGELGGTVQF